jgi:hypothetical protein
MYLSTGVPPSDIHTLLPAGDGKIGISYDTVRGWRTKDKEFADAADKILENADWFHIHIAVPMRIAAQDRARLEDFLVHNKTMKAASAQEMELLLQERGHIGGDESSATNEPYQEMLAKLILVQQETAVHAQPLLVEHE